MKLPNFFVDSATKLSRYLQLTGKPQFKKEIVIHDDHIFERTTNITCSDAFDAFPIEQISEKEMLSLAKYKEYLIDRASLNINKEDVIKRIVTTISTNYPSLFKKKEPTNKKALSDGKALLNRLMAQTIQSFGKMLREQSALVAKTAVNDFVSNAVQPNVLDKLNTSNINTGKLPRHCYSYRKVGKKEKFVIEQPPTTKTITISSNLGQKFGMTSGGRYEIAYPFIIFVVTLHNGKFEQYQVFTRNKPLSENDQTLHYPLFPNVWTDNDSSYRCKVCVGDNFVVRGNSSADIVNQAIDMFWAGEFNTDLADVFINAMARTSIRSFADWQQKSSRSSAFILSETLIPYSYNLDQITSISGDSGIDQTGALNQLKKNLIAGSDSIVSDLQILFASFRPSLDPQVSDQFVQNFVQIVNGIYASATQVAEEITNEKSSLYEISVTELEREILIQLADVYKQMLDAMFEN